MYTSTPEIRTPNGNTIIWRYMGIDKFLHLITQNQLFFTRLSKMTDKYEGTLPERNFIKRMNELIQKGIDPFPKALKEKKNLESFRNFTFLNCWTIGREESYALWKIYLGGASCGVAIKSTVGKLRKSIERETSEQDFHIGEVEYTNYIKDDLPNPIQLTVTKSLYYEYESELRVFFMSAKEAEENDRILSLVDGWNVDININTLIDKIYISPFTGGWFKDSFKDTLTSIQPELVGLIQESKIRDQ